MESIPYDPALVLGNIVDHAILDAVKAISTAGAPVDAAQDALNSLILAKRSLDMTVQELAGMNIDTSDLAGTVADLGKQVAGAAANLAKTVVAQTPVIMKAKADRGKMPAGSSTVAAIVESPLDYNKIGLKGLPLSADSIKMDAQYFALDENKQNSEATASTIKAFAAYASEAIGSNFSAQVQAGAQRQAAQQYQHHDIQGTLVITANCTHKNVQVIAPLAIDVDKAVRCWNALFPTDMIKIQDPAAVYKILAEANTPKDMGQGLDIISGVTYASCFVGMVHILNDTTTTNSQTSDSSSLKAQVQYTTEIIGFSSGFGAGFAASLSNDVKKMMSTQNIQSHCNMICMGLIPSIKSNTVKLAVKQFADFDPSKAMTQLLTLQEATRSDVDSTGDAANKARSRGEMQIMEGSKASSVLSAVSEIDDKENKMLDINSLMTAFESYVDKVSAGGTESLGVPVTYYMKRITKSQIANLFIGKYYPRLMHLGGDDVSTGASATKPGDAAKG